MSDSNKTANIAPSLSKFIVPIDSLTPDPANVRKHAERNISSIKASLVAFGQQKPVVVDSKGLVIAGNGTIDAARKLGWTHIAVVKSNLSGAERIAYAIADNRTAELAEWDDDALAQQLEALRDDDTIDCIATGFTNDEIAELVADDLSTIYTQKIATPIYEPGNKPQLSQLVDRTKRDQLLDEIAKAGISDNDIRDFLVMASQRFLIFDYSMIADYYANSSPDVQAIFEKLALVIIDFNKAIENGFVRLTSTLTSVQGEDVE